jgi:hypothetical protein
MKRENTTWNNNDGGEGRAGERLTERSARFVEKLVEKLARHNRDAAQLAEAMHHRRRDGRS